jgi:hypothetical protein
MTPWLVVPTCGDRAETLGRLVATAGMPTVVVWTGKGVARRPRGALAVHDHGPVNIHRWWNRGIDAALDHGADVVVVANDDVAAEPGALAELAGHLGPAVLAWPRTRRKRGRPTGIAGWCFALDPAQLRPDESFAWHYGDDDLCLRAGSRGKAVEGLAVVHCKSDRPRAVDPALRQLTGRDRRTFYDRYPEAEGWN